MATARLPPPPPISSKFSLSLNRENSVNIYFRLPLILKITLILIFEREKHFCLGEKRLAESRSNSGKSCALGKLLSIRACSLAARTRLDGKVNWNPLGC